MRYLIFIFFITSLGSYSQDTIRFRNGDIKIAKISEVGISNVKFRSFDNPDGPIYIADKNEIDRIKYKSGHIDTFSVNSVKISEGTQPIIATPALRSLSLKNKKVFFYNNIPLSKNDVEHLLQVYPNEGIRNKLLSMNEEANDFDKKAGLAVGLGLGFGFAIPVVFTFFGLVTMASNPSLDNAVTIIVAGAIVGAAVRISGAVTQKVNKNKAAHLRRQMVELYNNGMK